MIPVFVDTSALIALVTSSDPAHEAARRAYHRLRAREAPLLTTSYVLVETYALLGRRHGPEAVRAFREGVAPLLAVEWIGPEIHEAALDRLLAESSRRQSTPFRKCGDAPRAPKRPGSKARGGSNPSWVVTDEQRGSPGCSGGRMPSNFRNGVLSLVDVSSFLVAHRARAEEAFAFDRDFEDEGFRLVR